MRAGEPLEYTASLLLVGAFYVKSMVSLRLAATLQTGGNHV